MKRTIFPNGLTLLTEKDDSNIVAVNVYVKVGNNTGVKGTAHFVEHMMFEGTRTRTVKQISDELENVGGEISASTTPDYTDYSVVVPKDEIDVAVKVLADIVQNSTFLEESVKKERNILINELNDSKDDAQFVFELFYKTLFKKHPLRNEETPKLFKSITRNELFKFYKKYYVPNNIIISVVGNFKDINRKIKSAFTFKNKKITKASKIVEPIQNKHINVVKKKDFPISYVVLGYKTVESSHPDVYALRIISTYLGDGQSSKLFDELRNKNGLVYTLEVVSGHVIDAGDFLLFATGSKKDIPKIKNIFLKEVQDVKNITEKDLVKIKKKIECTRLVVMENKMNKTRSLISEEVIKRNFMKEIKKVSLVDIRRVVDKYFKFYTCVVVEKK